MNRDFALGSMHAEAQNAEKLLQYRESALLAAEKAAEDSAGGRSSSSSRAQRKGQQGRAVPDVAVLEALAKGAVQESARSTAAALRIEPSLRLIPWPGNGWVSAGSLREALRSREMRGKSVWLEAVRDILSPYKVYGREGDIDELTADVQDMLLDMQMGSFGYDSYPSEGYGEWSKYDELD
jgi:hypothetical protein